MQLTSTPTTLVERATTTIFMTETIGADVIEEYNNVISSTIPTTVSNSSTESIESNQTTDSTPTTITPSPAEEKELSSSSPKSSDAETLKLQPIAFILFIHLLL